MLIYNSSEAISKYFTMHEVSKSDIASRKYINNIPTTPVLEAAQALATNILDPIRLHFNTAFSPLSWYRCEQIEKILCNEAFITWANRQGLRPTDELVWQQYFSRKSHPKGEAADIQLDNMSNDFLYGWIRDNIPTYDQLIREYPKQGDPHSGWVHVSYSLTNNRKEQLTIK